MARPTIGPGVRLLAPPLRGEPIRAAFLSSLHGGLAYALQQVAPPKQLEEGVADIPKSSEGAGGGSAIVKYTITSEATNTVTASDSTVIAKPDHLRGAAGARTVTGEDQVILPAYVTGHGAPVVAAVYAIEVGAAVTGLAGVEWLDINAIARAWATPTPP